MTDWSSRVLHQRQQTSASKRSKDKRASWPGAKHPARATDATTQAQTTCQAASGHLRQTHNSPVLNAIMGPSPVTPAQSVRSVRSYRSSLQSIADEERQTLSQPAIRRSSSERRTPRPRRSIVHRAPRESISILPVVSDQEQRNTDKHHHAKNRGPAVTRHSSLRLDTTRAHGQDGLIRTTGPALSTSNSAPSLGLKPKRPHSHPPALTYGSYSTNDLVPAIPPLPQDMAFGKQFLSTPAHEIPTVLSPKPKPSFHRLSSLDNVITYREEVAAWKRASSILETRLSDEAFSLPEAEKDDKIVVSATETAVEEDAMPTATPPTSPCREEYPIDPGMLEKQNLPDKSGPVSTFRHFAAEVGFCFSIAMAQLLGEFLISGFALELTKLAAENTYGAGGNLGLFWPASLLSLILSATLLVFARLSDMYGGYYPFMFGLCWLALWTIIPAFAQSLVMLNVSRAMQGLAIAAFTPSTFVMVSSVYKDGPRKNFVLGLYSGCAPLGFFAGFMTAGALRVGQAYWYFWIVAALSLIAAITAYLSVPHDKTDRKTLGLEMDWLGAFLITAGLVLVAYGLSVSTYATGSAQGTSWARPTVYAPFVVGVVCLVAALWVEGWVAKCPLMPFDFFKPRSVTAFCLAGLCFYASYGAWLYTTTEFFESDAGTVAPFGHSGIAGITLAIWYTPTAITGLIMCIATGALLHVVPGKIILLFSGLAWIAASLVFAVCPYPIGYWSVVLPSMILVSLGLDLTFTVSLVYLSDVQPQRLQGVCGAVCSILVNLAISFSLSISQMVKESAANSFKSGTELSSSDTMEQTQWVFRSAFIYATASAGLGFAICVLFVHIPRADGKAADEEQAVPSPIDSETSTLVDEGEERVITLTPVNSAELDS